MAFTEADRDALKAAIAKGVTKAKINGEEVEFDTFAALRARLRMIEAELAGTVEGTPSIAYPKTTRGL